jgi:phage gp36-like protein
VATVQYATALQFSALGLPAVALNGFTGDVNDHLLNASGVVDTYLRGRYLLPLVSPYPQEIINAVCLIAAWTVLNIRGFDPSSGTDVNVRTRYEDMTGRPGQKGWLQQLSSGLVNLDLAADASSGVNDGGPIVASRSRTSRRVNCEDDWGLQCRGGRYDFWGNRC